ncbi:MAG TPA: Asp-tRNA(Asn)/Glu-tRNA(Gln) amidotransferase subunit GatB [Candidatus Paceibacterota bacterium]
MSKFLPTIGLEIHAELNTQSKMFCDCKNDPEEKRANQNVCPICLAHPGTLPVINKQAVESVIKVGLALKGEIPEVSKFDRKNYFYPDLPKGYQISQYDEPLVLGGTLAGVQITRVHLEEDTGRLAHGVNADNSGLNAEGQKESQRKSVSLVDFNRAGVPLMELVTEPVIHDVKTALTFAKELQLLLRYLGVSDADMEKGQMRVEANISLGEIVDEDGLSADERENNQHESAVLGTKVEVKNLNSFRAVQGAITYEIERQKELLEEGKKVTQETRGWNEEKKSTFSQRLKESAHDYRYFPEPDLPPLNIAEWDMPRLRAEISELPNARRTRLTEEYKLSASQVELLVSDRESGDYFENAASELVASQGDKGLGDNFFVPLYNNLLGDLRGLMNEKNENFIDLKITPENFSHLVRLVTDKEITSGSAKVILFEMYETGGDPEEIIKIKNWKQISDEKELKKIVLEIIAENPEPVADFKKGKENALQFLIGKAMTRLSGRGNPKIISDIFREKLK